METDGGLLGEPRVPASTFAAAPRFAPAAAPAAAPASAAAASAAATGVAVVARAAWLSVAVPTASPSGTATLALALGLPASRAAGLASIARTYDSGLATGCAAPSSMGCACCVGEPLRIPARPSASELAAPSVAVRMEWADASSCVCSAEADDSFAASWALRHRSSAACCNFSCCSAASLACISATRRSSVLRTESTASHNWSGFCRALMHAESSSWTVYMAPSRSGSRFICFSAVR